MTLGGRIGRHGSAGIYHGWVIVVVAALCYALANGAILNSFGLFVVPVSAELGLSRADMNTAFVIMAAGNGAVAPFVGRLVDKYPIKPIVYLSVVILAAGFLTLAWVEHLWICAFALALLLPIGLDGGAMLTLNAMVARWFNRYRSRALALSAIGYSLGGVLVPPVAALLIMELGWRMALSVLGIGLCLLIVLTVLFLRERPGPEDIEPGSYADNMDKPVGVPFDQGKPLPIMTIVRMRRFWLLSLALSLPLGIIGALSISLIPFATGEGYTTLQATMLVTVSSIAGVLAKLMLSLVGDLVGARGRIMMLLSMVIALILVNLAYPLAGTLALMLTCSAAFGAAYGVMPPLYQTLIPDLFGIASFGTLRGLLTTMLGISSAIFIRFAGEVFDRTGSYDFMFASFAVILTVSALLFAWLLIETRRPSTMKVQP